MSACSLFQDVGVASTLTIQQRHTAATKPQQSLKVSMRLVFPYVCCLPLLAFPLTLLFVLRISFCVCLFLFLVTVKSSTTARYRE